MDPTVSVLKCPQCGASIAPPSRFARQATCPFCGTAVQIDTSVVSVDRFRRSLERWNAPATHGFGDWMSIGDSCWTLRHLLGRGEVSDVYLADRARWPGERVAMKVLKDSAAAALFQGEWNLLDMLNRVPAGEPAPPPLLIPEPVVRGIIAGGPHDGSQAMAFRWASGFLNTLEDVRRVHAAVDPRVAVWMWRRILEVLAFLHRAGVVHGAVLPPHLLVQNNDHGVRLVGYGCAGAEGGPVHQLVERFAEFYPRGMRERRVRSAAADLSMSARCIAWVLGGDPATGAVPAAVPAPLAALIARQAAERRERDPESDAWSLRNEVGAIGRTVFGAPRFNPLVMPDEHRR